MATVAAIPNSLEPAARQAKFDRLLEALPDADREPVTAALKKLVEVLRATRDDRPSHADAL